MRRRQRWAAAALLLVACGRRGGGESEDAKAQENARPVVGARTAVATLLPLELTVGAIGTVAPRPGFFAQLAAPASARVARILVAPGQRVGAGTPLVELERAPFDAALRSAEAAVTTAQHAYDRAARLAQDGILPRKDVDQTAGELAQANATLVTARRAQELATLRAPIAGVVTRMTAVLGAAVEPSNPLVEIADPSALDVVLSVSPAEAALVRRGAAVTVTAGERASGERLGAGSVANVAAAVDSASRVVAVRARLPRPSRALRIGESVFATIVVGRHPRAVTVPAEALVPDGEGYKVFVVDSGGIAHARPVTVGIRTGALAEILSGVAAGETVVTYGAYGMEDSARVAAPPVRR